MATVKTKAEEAIEAQMREVPKGSYRYQVLECTLDFKHAWVSLGAELTKVRDAALYKEWGYEDFETYCQRELRIKKATAHKLTATYGFMQRHEPRLLAEVRDDPGSKARLPTLEVVSVLSRAEERGQIGETEYREVRDRVFDERSPSPAGLARVINAKWPPMPKPEPRPGARVKRLADAARRLADDAARCEQIPKPVVERVIAVAEDLADLVEKGAWRGAG